MMNIDFSRLLPTLLIGLFTLNCAFSSEINSNISNTSNISDTNNTLHGNKPFWEECELESGMLGPLFAIIYFILVVIVFVGLALVCDDYFVPSLEALSNMLNLSEDVAGATLMAAGSSAPELFTSLAATGVTSDVGIGTIVGSAVFNILIIISLSALFSGQKFAMQLDWRPFARDCIFYGFSIIIFISFSWDGLFTIYEAILMLSLYMSYIALMFVNKWLMLGLAWLANFVREIPTFCKRMKKPKNTVAPEGPFANEENDTQMQAVLNNVSKVAEHVAIQVKMSSSSISESLKDYQSKRNTKRKFTHHSTNFFHAPSETRGSLIRRHGSHISIIQVSKDHHKSESRTNLKHLAVHESHTAGYKEDQAIQMDVIGVKTAIEHSICETMNDDVNSITTNNMPNDTEDELESLPPIIEGPPSFSDARKNGIKGWIMYVIRWIIYVPSLPFSVVFAYTIPNSHYHREWYMVIGGFIMSIIWIGILSFITVILVGRSGCILGINHFTMGLVIVASGTSIPDALSSLLVARDGYGDMAISNAIGSNIFDLDLGLGLPFLVGIILNGFQPIQLYTWPEGIARSSIPLLPHPKFGFILLLILFVIIIGFAATKFKLRKILGIVFVGMYLLFVTYAMIQEFVCNGYMC
ncbi:hypothetical protein LOD99_6492 [Oopsacas minuta]|uniref:Sodium/calcium exchanger membrane region domain-containing protein n=1 Tax=Oopsacas minuta TaxID=111878 RepID=A0AAV7JLV5_9METZ|nr:hypothetical protein LOD99_6492 [Oopsacas minuta]